MKRRILKKRIRRTCRACKRRFMAKQQNRRYCCNACRQRAYRRRAWIDALRVFYPAPLVRLLAKVRSP